MSERQRKYGYDQHDLICEALNVSPDPEAPGDTAFEAVVRLKQRLAAAEAERDEARSAAAVIMRACCDSQDTAVWIEHTYPWLEAALEVEAAKDEAAKGGRDE